MSEIIFNTESLDKVTDGINKMANAVGATFGPNGKNVIIYKDKDIKITKDGVTVAKSIELENFLENTGAILVKEAASKTADSAGDGTTTATLLTAYLWEFFKKTNSINLSELQSNWDTLYKEIQDYLNSISIDATNPEILENVATVSANGDKVVGNLIKEIYSKIGLAGGISLEEAFGNTTYVDIVEGMQVESGYVSPYLITDTAHRKAILDKPYVLLLNNNITSTKDLFTLLEQVAQEDGSILIIANDFNPDVLTTVLRNVTRGLLKICLIKSPGVGEYKKDLLEDISILTNSTVFDHLPSNLSELSKIDRSESTFTNTVLINKNKINTDKIQTKIDNLRNSLKENDYPLYLKKDIEDRIAKLSGGIAVIHVGAPTTIEVSERKDRIEDALCASKAAIEEGVVYGAGTIEKQLLDFLCTKENTILVQALQYALNKLMIQLGDIDTTIKIFDPTKVIRVAIENAMSVNLMLFSTKCIIYND